MAAGSIYQNMIGLNLMFFPAKDPEQCRGSKRMMMIMMMMMTIIMMML